MTDTKNRTTDHSEKQDDTLNFRLLSRLQQDCEYYLGHGNRAKKHLWALDETEHIKKMKELYEGFHEKPEWISFEDIKKYEAAMIQPFGELSPPVASSVYRDWNITIREMNDDDPETYYEWFLEKSGSHFRDPTTHRSIQAAEKFAKDAVDSIIQDENDRIRRRHKKSNPQPTR